MSFFALKNGVLHAESVALPAIAEQFGTPAYVYSRAALTESLREFQDVLKAHPAGKGALVCYAVKANSNLAILNLFARLGAGFDIVSAANCSACCRRCRPEKVVFSGVGKTAAEMKLGLDAGIFCFNIESIPELERLNSRRPMRQAGADQPARQSERRSEDPSVHLHRSEGSQVRRRLRACLDLYRRAAALPNIAVAGIDCHIGSQLLDPSPFVEALERILALVDQLAEGIRLHHIDLGGGLGIKYKAEQVQPTVALPEPAARQAAGRGLQVVLGTGPPSGRQCRPAADENRIPGKEGEGKNFAIIDAAMNDLMRPALCEAWHDIDLVVPRTATRDYDVVGPVCETGDFLGQARPLCIQPGDLLAVMSAGAYGMAMASNYNTRPRAVE